MATIEIHQIFEMKLVAEITHDKHGSAIFTNSRLDMKLLDILNVEC